VDLENFGDENWDFAGENMGKTWGKHGENMGKIAKVHQSSQFLLQLRKTYIIIPFNCWLNILLNHNISVASFIRIQQKLCGSKNTFSFFK